MTISHARNFGIPQSLNLKKLVLNQALEGVVGLEAYRIVKIKVEKMNYLELITVLR